MTSEKKIKIAFLAIVLFLTQTVLGQKTQELADSLYFTTSRKVKIELSLQLAERLVHEDWLRALDYLNWAEKEAETYYEDDTIQGDVFATAGAMYQEKDVLDVALKFNQQAYSIFEKAQDVSEMLVLENNMAVIYARMKNTQKAQFYFRKVEQHLRQSKDSLLLAQLYNNIGNLFFSQQLDSAQLYFEQSWQLAKEINNKVLNTFVLTNLGRVAQLQSHNKTAKEYFRKALENADLTDRFEVKSFPLQTFAKFYLEVNQPDSALFYANKILNNYSLDAVSFTIGDAVKLVYEAHLKNNNYKEASAYFGRYLHIIDSLNVEEKLVNIERLKLQQEFEIIEKTRELEAQRKNFNYLLIVSALLLGILILILIVWRYRNKILKNKLNRELLLSKQKKLNQTLELKNNQLVQRAMGEIHRTEIIESILDELKKIQRKAVKKETQHDIDLIINKLKRDLDSDVWQEFEISFEQVHQAFYTKLQSQHPELTAKDRRLCALLLIDLSSKEISQITGQSFKAIENARTRLRKKLNLTNSKVNLSNYLNSLAQ